MKKEEKLILDEINEAISCVKSELSRLEGLARELASRLEESEVEPAPAPEVEPVPAPEVEPVPASEVETEPETDAMETVTASETESVETKPASPEEDFISDAEPAIVAMAAEKPKAKKAVVDAMLTDEAWRTDMPSSEVKDIRSAIALNDRILVINKLFVGDAEDFQTTVAALNEMATLDDAVDFLKERYPDWKWNSDIVYRFMMAVRRKIR